jgi:hypothetical protein
MKLKLTYKAESDIPDGYIALFTETAGEWKFTGVDGMKTAEDVARSATALKAEREQHKETKTKLAAWGDLEPDDTRVKLDRIEELEEAASGSPDQVKIDEMVERRLAGALKVKLGPVERERDKLKGENETLLSANTGYQAANTERTIQDKIRSVLVEQKVHSHAIGDALLLASTVFEVTEDGTVSTRDGAGVSAGMDPTTWLTEIQSTKPHWWPETEGGGSTGGGPGGPTGGKNPFTRENWDMTAQGQLVNSKGMEVAERQAKAAGTTVGGPKPAPKK